MTKSTKSVLKAFFKEKVLQYQLILVKKTSRNSTNRKKKSKNCKDFTRKKILKLTLKNNK
jgi:hypothetical protein